MKKKKLKLYKYETYIKPVGGHPVFLITIKNNWQLKFDFFLPKSYIILYKSYTKLIFSEILNIVNVKS